MSQEEAASAVDSHSESKEETSQPSPSIQHSSSDDEVDTLESEDGHYTTESDDDDDDDDDDLTQASSFEAMMEKLRRKCRYDDAESALLGSVVDLTHVPPNYSHLHYRSEILDTLDQATYMSIDRRDQFAYGVLKDHQLTGALLYGPPGTGKTALVKAMAKEKNFRMLALSSADIYHKYWGENEKTIRAAFRLARKLQPCIMFVDEADGILGTRRDEDKKHVQSMMSEFLSQWDGSSASAGDTVFVLLATNMPWDIDPAALRRAPVRILIDLPTAAERRGILEVLLRDEKCADDATIATLADLTQAYSGSDLKNLCVQAAMICLRQQKTNGHYETVRVLTKEHFRTAMLNMGPTAANRTLAKKYLAFARQ